MLIGAKMIKKEIYSILRDKRSIIFIVLILLIPMIDLFLVCNSENVWEKRANKVEILRADEHLKKAAEEENVHYASGWIIHPAKASYLSGSSGGHLTQIILIWLMPIFVLNLFSDRYISEYSRKYTNAVLSRTNRIKYISDKLIVSFIVPFAIFLLSLLINFGIAQIIFMDGYNFNGLEVFKKYGGWFEFMYNYPNMAYIVYIILAAIVAGICGILCQSIALVSKKYTLSYLLSFFIWMALIMMKDSMTYIVQPFTEYGIESMIIPASVLGIMFVCCLFVTVFVKGRADEL